MSSATTLVITINPLDPARDAYLIQLLLAGKQIAEATTQIDRQRLLELEYSYNAHDYGMALYDALLIGNVNREYQRLVGKAGATDTVPHPTGDLRAGTRIARPGLGTHLPHFWRRSQPGGDLRPDAFLALSDQRRGRSSRNVS